MTLELKQAEGCRPEGLHFLYMYRKESVFPILSGKGLGLPAFCRKAALTGLAGREKIILAALRYFFPPGLAQKGNPRVRGL